MRNSWRLLTPLVAAGLAVAACSSGGTPQTGGQATPGGSAPPATQPAQQPAQAGEFPRNETLYSTGTMWGPPANFNPMDEGNHATGTVGLVYETLFHFDTNAKKLTPWLAESGSWTDDKTYVVKLRSGVTWNDGKPFTAKDVAFTYGLGKIKGSAFAHVWDWLEAVEATDDQTVTVKFKSAKYSQWDFELYQRAIVPQHIWEGKDDKDVLTGMNENPVGTGAYKYASHADDRVVYERRDDWWGKTALNMEPKPKYFVHIVTPSNEVALGLFMQKQLDLANNYIPGMNRIAGEASGIHTYYSQAPYNLSANTAWLVPNTTKKPLNDAAFRKALATSVDVPSIVKNVYGEVVQAASPTGLLPGWKDFDDQAVIGEKGFTFNTDNAKKMLADAGYKDKDGDGLVENKDGSKISLKLITPAGWSDWNQSASVIATSAKAAGIDVTAETPDFPALLEARNAGKFDLVINNERQLSVSPWTYYDYLFRQPVNEVQNTVNFGRYENKQAWDLVQQLDAVKTDDVEGMKKVISQLQAIHLDELPAIPLWYNGVWSQASTGVWKNWGADGGANKYPAVFWRHWFEMGGFETLTQLQTNGS
ncbi:ABC transporter substrate-binding protein [Nonomuraea sp. NPDC050663]|uniref:ABC transporter substrate-binding protein n=1 Tax=Nonomuraea sp. NPDC050663 TaxID=3364370 RepID=UPI00378BAC44